MSSKISKLFEMCLSDLLGKYITSSDLQSSFKKGVGCRDAIYALQSVVDFYTEHGSTVNLCLLDMSKAFDKVNHYGLFIKLMKRKTATDFFRILINWYSKCCGNVRWDYVFPSVFLWSVVFVKVGFSHLCCSRFTLMILLKG